MHLGNIYTALMSWLSAKSAGGDWLLRIEDLDPQRSRVEYARQIEEDLHWLGLDWDEGGLDNIGDAGPYCQSMRSSIYAEALGKLTDTGYIYPCFCTRADIMATQAPHQSDGRIIYAGTCRPSALPSEFIDPLRPHACRLYVPDTEICFCDAIYGEQRINLAKECGDFVLRRADGAWAYQLSVVVDDGLMGVTEVVRGNDLLLSAAQQQYLYALLCLPAPRFVHLPLVCTQEGRRLSKRDHSLSMEEMRHRLPPDAVIGRAAYLAGLTDRPEACTPKDLLGIFNIDRIPKVAHVTVPEEWL